MSLVVVGDALLDRDLDGRAERLAPDAPVPVVDDDRRAPAARRRRPGGGARRAAGATTHARQRARRRRGRPPRSRRCSAARASSVSTSACDGPTPEKVRVRAGGRTLVRLDRGGDGPGCGPLDRATARAALARRRRRPRLRLRPRRRRRARRVRAALAGSPRAGRLGPAPAGRRCRSRASCSSTPNERRGRRSAGGRRSLARRRRGGRARRSPTRWRAANVCVTRGARGALLVAGDGPALAVPAPRVVARRPVRRRRPLRRGRRGRLAAGALPSEAVRAAVAAASAFVGAGGAAAAVRRAAAADPPAPASGRGGRRAGARRADRGRHRRLLRPAARRPRRMLQAARALGDCLVVCLNSDASVRRLKGPDRPLVGQDDRAAVLAGARMRRRRRGLRRGRPAWRSSASCGRDVWAKGGDYALADLPEAEVLADWGGQAVIVPYVDGPLDDPADRGGSCAC